MKTAIELRKKDVFYDKFEIIKNMGSDLKYITRLLEIGELDLNPFYQRGLVWTLKQKQKYIINLFEDKAEFHPTIILNGLEKEIRFEMLDGKQRFSAILGFIDNEFKLENGYYFKDLIKSDKDYIERFRFSYTRIANRNYSKGISSNEKIELFIRINALGTKMSDEHLEKISKIKEKIDESRN